MHALTDDEEITTMTKLKPYTIEFLAKQGCPQGIVLDMARFDAAHLIEGELTDGSIWRANDQPGYPIPPAPNTAFRWAKFQPKVLNCSKPTMARWASFVVGARLVEGA